MVLSFFPKNLTQNDLKKKNCQIIISSKTILFGKSVNGFNHSPYIYYRTSQGLAQQKVLQNIGALELTRTYSIVEFIINFQINPIGPIREGYYTIQSIYLFFICQNDNYIYRIIRMSFICIDIFYHLKIHRLEIFLVGIAEPQNKCRSFCNIRCMDRHKAILSSI